jgi:hypothetical protein
MGAVLGSQLANVLETHPFTSGVSSPIPVPDSFVRKDWTY